MESHVKSADRGRSREERNRMAKAATVFALALLTGIVLVTGAIFTSTASIGANTFTTGTVTLTTSPTTALVTFTGMAPGDQVTAPVAVNNTGSLQLRYAVTSTTTENVLASQLQLTVKSGVTTCTNAAYAASGTVLYNALVLGNTTAVNVVGDPTQGAQAGDRTLNAGASENLCFHVSLPLASGNAFQNLTTTATFAFIGEQTANN
jgi:spore coat-associated protein N